jgi:hypothetical protein
VPKLEPGAQVRNSESITQARRRTHTQWGALFGGLVADTCRMKITVVVSLVALGLLFAVMASYGFYGTVWVGLSPTEERLVACGRQCSDRVEYAWMASWDTAIALASATFFLTALLLLGR